MALSDKKIVSYEVNIKDLSDTPSADGVPADQLKAMFDARTDDEVMSSVNGVIDELLDSGAVAETYTESLLSKDIDPESQVLLVTDTATLRSLSDQGYTVLRDYGDAFWCVRMAINDATAGFTESFTLPEAPRYGVGRGDVTG